MLNRNSHGAFQRLLLISLLMISLGWADKSFADKPKLQLATVYHAGLDVSDYWVSEKLDGVRGYWDGKQLLTRQGYRIHAPDWFTQVLPEQPLDGELWIGRGKFNAVSSLVRSASTEASQGQADRWRRVKFMLFDLPQFPGTFTQRLQQLGQLVDEIDRDWVQLIDQRRVSDDSTLMAWLKQVVADDGEGLMLHHQDALYQSGRSAQLLKLKLWQDAEAKVIGHQPGKGKYVGMLGALLVETPTGIRFKLGSGFTDQQRQHPPAIGSIVTYKYTGVSAKGVPRFASFMRVRQP
ncbi:DNA ligase [Amphritea opalescens]|uniref:DNA ligase n=2 Tax=Amphritea opalescens TaxID=2490544 RepID=A0A430KN85_9GAMM|nr:DNA ligase [Amphritea opalescens]